MFTSRFRLISRRTGTMERDSSSNWLQKPLVAEKWHIDDHYATRHSHKVSQVGAVDTSLRAYEGRTLLLFNFVINHLFVSNLSGCKVHHRGSDDTINYRSVHVYVSSFCSLQSWQCIFQLPGNPLWESCNNRLPAESEAPAGDSITMEMSRFSNR